MTAERLIRLSAIIIRLSGSVGSHQSLAVYVGLARSRAGGRRRRKKMRTNPSMRMELRSIAPIASVASRR